MAAIECQIHGTTIAALVSPEIREDFQNNKQGPSEEYYQIRTTLFDQDVTFCWLSSKVANQFGIPVNQILSWDEFSSNLEQLSLEPICGACFREWISKNN